MALPFKVFDYEQYEDGWAYCLRCQWWVPTDGPFTGGLDPHIENHLVAWSLMTKIQREQHGSRPKKERS